MVKPTDITRDGDGNKLGVTGRSGAAITLASWRDGKTENRNITQNNIFLMTI